MPYYPERKPEPSGEKQRNTTAEKRNRLLRLSVAAFFSLLVLYGAIRLFRYQSELNDSRNTAAELRRIQNPEEIKAESTDLPVPKTGDNSNPALWIALMVLGLAGIGAMLFRTARKRG